MSVKLDPYVPSHEKWIKYYESNGVSEHPYYYQSDRTTSKHAGGSIACIGETRQNGIIPIEKRPKQHSEKVPELKVEFVSPAQQVVEQAASEIRRDKSNKRKHVSSLYLSDKKRRCRLGSKGKNSGDHF